jgi:hypothetical protein
MAALILQSLTLITEGRDGFEEVYRIIERSIHGLVEALENEEKIEQLK